MGPDLVRDLVDDPKRLQSKMEEIENETWSEVVEQEEALSQLVKSKLKIIKDDDGEGGNTCMENDKRKCVFVNNQKEKSSRNVYDNPSSSSAGTENQGGFNCVDSLIDSANGEITLEERIRDVSDAGDMIIQIPEDIDDDIIASSPWNLDF